MCVCVNVSVTLLRGGGSALRSSVEAWEPHSSQRLGFIVGYIAFNASAVCLLLCLRLMRKSRRVEWALQHDETFTASDLTESSMKNQI